MTDSPLRDQWHRLPSTVTDWLFDNPGCVIIPRTLSAEISAALDQPLTWDVHGETSLSEEDVEFIRMKAHENSDGKPDTGYTFFDSVQP
ncbi:hypothetical protein QE394_000757 [Arthrobacter sp. SORGH_AS 212]|jgi:hypothetical protein|uniref:hypothetical protein n=1 Tax=Pseudarthrobacter TaxID=1742993 RepID=UPI0021C10BCA|nr:hypothetical protein [Pseudarthrobacter equi]MCT9627482.1 hypothetical protein [Pseudarthrobacter equi]MDQ1052829.1 hypothetical protein [Arthrobacter sp. SORGH_AS_0212]